ncbi:hypothetical protein BGZ83_001690 [Gryganskiella cystojenkinii]|nr:hypothetical protein BGZ83_001690 [Gryganskiella cystojenkinii]
MSINRGNVVLVIGMLVAGTANTVITKYQDKACVKNCDLPVEEQEHFEQPLWQTLNMFVGESLCLVVASICAFLADKYGRAKWADLILDDQEDDALAVVESDGLIVPEAVHGHGHGHGHGAPSKKKKLEGALVLLLWLPTLCDMTASTLMNVGLIYCAASVYQMLRGALVILTGLLSVIFLGRRLLAFEWFALFTISAGIATVGLSSVLAARSKTTTNDDPDSDEAIQAAKAVLGIFLVLFAQIFTATQFVIEEKFLSGYQIAPLRAVGYEGVFGTISVLVAMPLFHFTYGVSNPGSSLDLRTGWEQIRTFPQIWIPAIIMLFSISSFNFFGISVTKTVSATSRSTIDSCRTLFIWAISLYLGWEKFSSLQVVGFVMLVYGTFVFNGVIAPHVCAPPKAINEGETRPLLQGSA